MAYDERLEARIRDALGPRRDMVGKKMFGGITFMLAGRMACGIIKADLMIRVDPARAEILLKRPGARPMDFAKRPMAGFLYVAPVAVKTAASLKTWIGEAVAYAAEQGPKAKPRPKSRAGVRKGSSAPAGRKKQ